MFCIMLFNSALCHYSVMKLDTAAITLSLRWFLFPTTVIVCGLSLFSAASAELVTEGGDVGISSSLLVGWQPSTCLADDN